METKSVFEVLSAIDCNSKVEKKNGLTYLSWVWAWGITKKHYPDLSYKVITYDGKPYLFDADLGYLVSTEVTINGETLPMQLPVMDGANKAQKNVAYTYKTKFGDKTVEKASMFDINTAIMRCLTKNLALFGLGHYIYAGEDLPEVPPVVIDYSKEEALIAGATTLEELVEVWNLPNFPRIPLEHLKNKRKDELAKH